MTFDYAHNRTRALLISSNAYT